MASHTLLDADVSRGLMTVNALDRIAFPINAALWLFDADLDRWRFVMASSRVNDLGQTEAYAALLEALNDNACTLRLDEITLVSPQNSLVRSLGSMVEIEGVSQTRFSNSSINGVFVEDALVYRLRAA